MTEAVFADGLSKRYGERLALDRLSLSLSPGSVFGFLGPNGAGKTTTVKLLTGLLTPTEGSCTVFGLDPCREPEKVHALCGVVTESARLYPQFSGLENLSFFGELCGLARAAARERAESLLRRLGLWEAASLAAGTYSTGMAQRLSLARALVGEPKLLFLDEPTSGLDPESAQAVNELIAAQAAREGVTVFLCTHQLRYAQDLCGSYGILHHGTLLALGDLPSLAEQAGCRSHAVFRLGQGEVLPGFSLQEGSFRRPLRSEEEMPALVRDAVQAGLHVYEARLERPTLEDVYFRFVGHEEGGQTDEASS